MFSTLYANSNDKLNQYGTGPSGRQLVMPDVTEFQRRQFRTEWMRSFFTNPNSFENLTLETPEKRQKYRELMLREPTVISAFDSMIARICSYEPQVLPYDDRHPKNKEAAEYAKAAIDECANGGWHAVIKNIATGALIDGYGLNEIVLDYPEMGSWRKYLCLAALDPIDVNYVNMDIDAFRNVVGIRANRANSGILFDPGKFTLFSYQSLFKNPYGRSMFRGALRAATMIESTTKLRLIMIQNFTGPFLVGKFSDPEARLVAADLLERARSMGYINCAPEDSIEVLDFATGTSETFQSALDDWRKEVYTATRWAYLPFLEGQSGSDIGDSTVARGVTELGEWMLAMEVCNVIRYQIVKPLMKLNYTDRDIGLPRVLLGGMSPDQRLKRGNVLKLGQDLLGMHGLSLAQVQQTLGLESPKNAADKLVGQNAAMSGMSVGGFPGMGGMGGMGGAPVPGAPTAPPAGGGKPDFDPKAGIPGKDGQPVKGVTAFGGHEDVEDEDDTDLEGASGEGTEVDTDPAPGERQVNGNPEMSRAILLAIMNLRLRAQMEGHQHGFGHAIDVLQDMLSGDNSAGDSMDAMQAGQQPRAFMWMAQQTSTGNVKAVGMGDHAGKTLYGPKAKAALHAQQGGEQHYAQAATESKQKYDKTQASKADAIKLAGDVMNDKASPKTFRQLAGHLDALNVNELKRVRDRLATRFTNGRRRDAMVQSLQTHALIQAGYIPDPHAGKDKGPQFSPHQEAVQRAAAAHGQGQFTGEHVKDLQENLHKIPRGELADMVEKHTQWGNTFGMSRHQMADAVIKGMTGGMHGASPRAAYGTEQSDKLLKGDEVEPYRKDATAGATESTMQQWLRPETKAAGASVDRPVAAVQSGEVAKRPNGTPSVPSPSDVYTVPTSSLVRDPKRFQYKVMDVDEGGIGSELKGAAKWNPELGGAILAWRDPASGQDVVVNGHNRHGLAERTGQDTMNVRYIDAKDAVEARSRGALANIAEGRGTAIDAAKYLRDTGEGIEHLRNAGLSVSGKMAQDAVALANLNERSFQRLTNGQLDEATAVAVAKNLPDHARQEQLFQKLERRAENGEREWNRSEIETAARKMADAGSYTEKETNLFGDFENEKNTFDQEVEIQSFAGRKLSQAVGDYAAVSSEARAGRVAGAGNVLAIDENQKRKQDSAYRLEVFNRLQNRSGPISQAVKVAAIQLATAKSQTEKDHVKQQSLAGINAAIDAELGRPLTTPAGAPAVGDDAGAKAAGGTGDAGTPQPAGPNQAPGLSASPHAPNDLLDAEIAKPESKPASKQQDDILGDFLAKPAEQPKPAAPDLNDEAFGKKNLTSDDYQADAHEDRLEHWTNAGHDDEYAETLAKTPWNSLSDKQRAEYAKARGQSADDQPASVSPARKDPNPGEAIPPAPDAGDKPTPPGMTRNLLGDLIKLPAASPKAGQQLSLDDAHRELDHQKAEEFAAEHGLNIEQRAAGSRFKMDGEWYRVGKAADGYPVAKESADAQPTTEKPASLGVDGQSLGVNAAAGPGQVTLGSLKFDKDGKPAGGAGGREAAPGGAKPAEPPATAGVPAGQAAPVQKTLAVKWKPITREKALELHGGMESAMPKPGETKPQMGDNSGKFQVKQDADGSFAAGYAGDEDHGLTAAPTNPSEAFKHGYANAHAGENPHLPTSNMSDAHVLGAWMKNKRIPIDGAKIKKSRGNLWTVDGKPYRVNGNEVQEVDQASGQPIAGKGEKVPTARKVKDSPKMGELLDGQGITNSIGSEPQTPAASDEQRNQLENEGPRRGEPGLPAGQPVGTDAPGAPAAELPGTGGGNADVGRLRAVPTVADLGSDGPAGPDGDGGQRPVGGERVRPESISADPAGRSRPARGVGSGSRDVRPDGVNPEVVAQSPAEQSVAKPSTPENPTDAGTGNFQYTSKDFATGGARTKFAANVAAIKTLQAIKAEGRTTATPEEQQVMSRYVGWGQFPGLFNRYGNEWRKEREILEGLLTPEEYDAASASKLNAHYTAPEVVDAHWKMADRLGFKGGRFLETSAGIGYYLGMMPSHIAGNTKTTAVELDPTTGGMLGHLYPNANVKVHGFEKLQSPEGFYDLVASNVPFGDYRVHDPKYNKHGANIHDYFFLKSADLVRPGGLVMHITSTGTLDKMDPSIRQQLGKTCDLVSAIRFPSGAHKSNAGTDVVTDMLILRKRLPGEPPSATNWMETTTVPDPAGGEAIPINRYFAENPGQVLGTVDRTGSMYQGNSVNVTRTADYEQRLAAAIDRLPKGLYSAATAPKERYAGPAATPAPGEVRAGGFKVDGGKVYIRQGDQMVEQADVKPAVAAKIQAHMTVRDAMRDVLNTQIAGGDATAARAMLNAVYDQFVKEHGPLNAKGNKAAFRTDPDSPILLAMEKANPKTGKFEKADIFHKDTIKAVSKVEKANDPSEALGVVLHESGGVDVDRIAALTSLPREAVEKHLVDAGLAYSDPSAGWQPADQYLSGNVRRKLAMARAAAETDPKFAANVAALEKVQPEDVSHEDIEAKLGVPWVPSSDVSEFAASLLGGQNHHFKISYLPHSGAWIANYSNEGKRYVANTKTATEVWATPRKSFDELFEAALNNTSVRVTDKISDGSTVVNREETDNANAKIQEIKDKFKEWLWTDDERRDRLHRHYNDNFNNVVPMKYNGQHLQFPGMNPGVKLRDHQANAVWQVVTTGKGLLGHEVGTGKTYTMGAAAMELRRLGLAKKPAIACLKANIEQVTRELQHLYPGAKILSTVDNFDKANRKKTISQIATGDYDMVIMTHDNLDMLQMKPETVAEHIRDELKELEAVRSEMMANEPKGKQSRAQTSLENAKKNLEAKLQEALDPSRKDDAVFFEETGIDHIFVDEAHNYKSLPCYTKQQGLKGVPTGRSAKATAMYMRTKWLMENNGGRGVVFATGTPVDNTMAELYNMQRYLQPQELKERGLHTFDAWASTFGDVQTKMEFTVAGDYKPVSRFAKFTNIPELMQMSRQMLDIQRADAMKNPDGSASLIRPKREDSYETAPKTPEIARLMDSLQTRAQNLKRGGKDNMLVICTDGRKGALDMRLLDPNAVDHPDSKTNLAVRNVLKINKEHPGRTQMIFSDIGVNDIGEKGGDDDNLGLADVYDKPGEEGDVNAGNSFNLYGDIIEKLVKGGIPREKIADFSKLAGEKKENAMQAMREGKILVAIGSSKKMGTGVNVQDKLYALHHLDVPWTPASVEQRNGRAWRQGNMNDPSKAAHEQQVKIVSYVTEGSLDRTFWQIIGNKLRFVKQVMTPGGTTQRAVGEEDAAQLTPEQLMAAASGDPRVLQKVQLDEDLKNLHAGRKRHDSEQYKLKAAVASGERNLPMLERHAENLAKDAGDMEKHVDFKIHLNGQDYADRPEAEKALEQALKDVQDPYGIGVRVGQFKGLQLMRRGEKLYLESKHHDSRFGVGESLKSIEYVARNLQKGADAAKDDIARAKADIARTKAGIGKEFPKAAELKQKMEALKKLEEELKGENKKPAEGTPEAEKSK